jgi:hypothetical protein
MDSYGELQAGYHNQRQIVAAWTDVLQADEQAGTLSDDGWIRERLNETPPEAEPQRANRIRLFSLDGQSDPRNNMTELDTSYIIMSNLAPLSDSYQVHYGLRRGDAALHNVVAHQRDLVWELEGGPPADRYQGYRLTEPNAARHSQTQDEEATRDTATAAAGRTTADKADEPKQPSPAPPTGHEGLPESRPQTDPSESGCDSARSQMIRNREGSHAASE